MKRYLLPVLLALVAAATASVMPVRSLGACSYPLPREILMLQIDSVRVEGLRENEFFSYDGFSVQVEGLVEQTVALVALDKLSGLSYFGTYTRQ